MNVVIARWGSSGDVLPSVAVGRELRRRGHSVTLVANPHFKAQATDAGLSFAAVGTLSDYEKLTTDPDVWERSRKSPEQIYTDHYYPHMAGYYETVRSLCQTAPSVVIGGEAGAATAAEKLSAPFVHILSAPALTHYTRSRYHRPHPERVLPTWATWFGRTGKRMAFLYLLNSLRHGRPKKVPANLQLPETHPLARLRLAEGLPLTLQFRPRLAIGLWPEWYAPPQPDWSSEVVATGFPLSPPPSGGSGERPIRGTSENTGPIVITTGSIVCGQDKLYATAVKACQHLGRAAILVTPHRDQIPRDLPSGIRHVEFAPYHEVFKDASLVLHHGGIGTTSFALAAGVPQIVMPIRGDQFDNGNRLQRLGVGAMLSPTNTAAGKLAAVINTLTTSRRVRERCQACQARIDLDEGLRRTGDCIERAAALS